MLPNISGSRSGLAPLVVWGLLGGVTCLYRWGSADARPALLCLGLLAFLLGTWAFWVHGGRQITAAGTYSLASAGFVGYAGMWWARRPMDGRVDLLFTATAVSFFAHLLMYTLFWHRQRNAFAGDRPLRNARTPGPARWGRHVGAVMIAAALGTSWLAPGLNRFYVPVAFVGITLLTVGMLVAPGPRRKLVRKLVIVALLSAVFVQTMFTGYGRLVIVALALAPAVLVAGYINGRIVKASVLLGAPLVVIVLTHVRTIAATERYGAGAFDPTATDSTVGPLQTFSSLLGHTSTFDYGLGSTFFSSATLMIPRSIWSTKPEGFGSTLTAIFAPEQLRVGGTLAALAQGEWYFNFGPYGLALMIPIVGLFVQLLDRLLLRGLTSELNTRATVAGLAALAIVISGIPDFVWNGSGTFTSRAGFRLLILLAVYALSAWKVPNSSRARVSDFVSSYDARLRA